MTRARDGVDNDDDGSPVAERRTATARSARRLRCAAWRRAGARAVAAVVLAMLAARAADAAPPKPSPTPNPMVGEMENVVAELRELNATLASLRTAIGEVGGRLDRLEQATTEVKATALPMREEVRGLYVETSNVRSEIARLEEKSVAEAESLGKSRYVLTLLLVATAVLQLVVLAVLLRSR